MYRHCILLAAFAAGLFGLIGAASALTVDVPVTPAYVKENPKQFAVVVEKRADGLLHFTITRTVSRPSYLVAHSELREGAKALFQSTACAFVREDSATYFVVVSPERVEDAKFELFDGSFTESDGHATPVVGGTNYQIQLGEFAKTAGEGR